MIFLDLPVEVGILIFKYLDFKSKLNVYNSCISLRRFFAPSHVKTVILSRNTLGCVKSLTQELIIDYASFIQELNLSGIPGLTPAILKPCVGRLTQLKTLDITFTDIYLSDLPDLCPENLKNISMNFFKMPRYCDIEVHKECLEVFIKHQFQKVHFIAFDFMDSDTPLLFLKSAPAIDDLKITVADNYKDLWEDYNDMFSETEVLIKPNFSKLNYIFRDCRVGHTTAQSLRGVANMDFDEIEYIYFMYLECIDIYASPIFKKIFTCCCSDLRVKFSTSLPMNFMLDGNIIFKAWNKSRIFDDAFFEELRQELADYFPSFICMHKKVKMTITDSPSNWYCIDACNGFEKMEDLPNKITLTDFCRKSGNLVRRNKPISLSPGMRLKNLTFLRLSNIYIRDSFFTILFYECEKLETLDLHMEKRGRLSVFRRYALSLAASVHMAKSLKNIKITSEDIEYKFLLETLGRCKLLENIHICEYERNIQSDDVVANDIVILIKECRKLYSVFIEADMCPETLTLLMSPLKEVAQKYGLDHLCIDVRHCYRGWNPFVDVFSPSPLHILF